MAATPSAPPRDGAATPVSTCPAASFVESIQSRLGGRSDVERSPTSCRLLPWAPRRMDGKHQLMDIVLNYWQITLFVPGIFILLGVLALVTNRMDRR